MAGRYDDIWHDNVSESRYDTLHDRTGYSERELIQHHLSIFMDLPGMEEEPRHVKYELWDRYTEVMVAGYGDRGQSFWAELGIDSRDFDWQAWREAMGY